MWFVKLWRPDEGFEGTTLTYERAIELLTTPVLTFFWMTRCLRCRLTTGERSSLLFLIASFNISSYLDGLIYFGRTICYRFADLRKLLSRAAATFPGFSVTDYASLWYYCLETSFKC